MVKGFLKEDILLMCSDGLTNMIDTKDIYDEIIKNKTDLKKTCQHLIRQAKENGGYDNISVILISND